jgi:hypothetical protein
MGSFNFQNLTPLMHPVKRQKVTFIVGSPIKHLIPLYVIPPVFSYDIDFSQLPGIILAQRKE